jgi:hypothetical protein
MLQDCVPDQLCHAAFFLAKGLPSECAEQCRAASRTWCHAELYGAVHWLLPVCKNQSKPVHPPVLCRPCQAEGLPCGAGGSNRPQGSCCSGLVCTPSPNRPAMRVCSAMRNPPLGLAKPIRLASPTPVGGKYTATVVLKPPANAAMVLRYGVRAVGRPVSGQQRTLLQTVSIISWSATVRSAKLLCWVLLPGLDECMPYGASWRLLRFCLLFWSELHAHYRQGRSASQRLLALHNTILSAAIVCCSPQSRSTACRALHRTR